MEVMKFKLNDWRTNSSILGLMNILDNDRPGQYSIKRDGILEYLELPISSLEGFQDKYFKYFIDTYEEELPWKRMVNIEGFLQKWKDRDLAEFDEDDLKTLNVYIELYKDYLSRNNYKKVYDLVEPNNDIEEKIKSLKKVNKRKKDEMGDLLPDIEYNLKILKELFDFCNTEKGRKYLGAKGIIYSHVNRGIDGVSFLNRQTKEMDPYEDYRKYFLEGLEDYILSDKKNFKYQCFNCANPIDTIGNSASMNLVNFTGIDDGKKSNHLWNENRDNIICKVCQFLFTCLPAGFTYRYYEGIFINANSSIEMLKVTNRTIRTEEEAELKNSRGAGYRALVDSISSKKTENLEYELDNIQIIRYKDEGYKFNLLSKDSIKLVKESMKDIKAIEATSYSDGNYYYSIYDEVLDRIFNNGNMYNLIHNLFIYKLNKTGFVKTYYNYYHIGRIININARYLKEVMEVVTTDEINKLVGEFRNYGYYLAISYREIDNNYENKIRGMSYRMLNALKTRNADAFMNNVINSHMYVKKSMPKKMTLLLENDDNLGTLGYAFVAGLNGLYEKEGDNNEK